MQITHEQARRLIQLNADQSLYPSEKYQLSAHLKDCSACHDYAEEINELEGVLRPIMKRLWGQTPLPLSIHDLRVRSYAKRQSSLILATRSALIGAVCLAFLFSAWQFMRFGGDMSGPLQVGVSAVPLPATHSTNTASLFESCGAMHYTVQETDTLESIAHQFGISQDELIVFNQMRTQRVSTGMTLMVPTCNFTPTSTLGPSLFTETYIPLGSPTTSTPGSY